MAKISIMRISSIKEEAHKMIEMKALITIIEAPSLL